MKALWAIVLALPLAPPPALPSLPVIAHIRIEIAPAHAIVTEDIRLARGDWKSGDLDLYVAFGAPGVPRAFDAKLIPLADGEFDVEDAAAAYTLLVERLAQCPDLRGEAFNFSNESPITVTDLVKQILSLMGSSLEPEVRNEASNEIREQYLSAAKARELLGGWAPLFSLEEGLKRTIAWYETFCRMGTRHHAAAV